MLLAVVYQVLFQIALIVEVTGAYRKGQFNFFLVKNIVFQKELAKVTIPNTQTIVR